MDDTFIRGFEFDGVTGLQTGENLEDLVTQATLTEDSNILDGVTLGTVDDGGIYKAEIIDGGITKAKMATGAVIPTRAEAYNFWAYAAATGQVLTTLISADIQFTAKVWDDAAVYSTSTYKFTSQRKGIYLLASTVTLEAALGTTIVAQVQFWVNGAQYLDGDYHESDVLVAPHASGYVYLDVGDYATVKVVRVAAPNQTVSGAHKGITWFQGSLVCTVA